MVDAKKSGAAAGMTAGNSFSAKFGASMKQGLGIGAGIGAFGLLSSAVSTATGYMTDAVAKAKEEEVGISRLGASLSANVKDWDGNTAGVEKYINAMVRTTGFSDGAMRDSLALLVASTHDVAKAQKIMGTAMDLARFKGISLEDASTALVKIEGGQFKALKALGIQLPKNASAEEALAAVQKVATGQMAAYMDTAAGKADVLNNRLEDIQETLGGKVTPALIRGTEAVNALLDAFDPEYTGDIVTTTEDLAALAGVLNVLTGNTALGKLVSGMADGASESERLQRAALGIIAKGMETRASLKGIGDAISDVGAAAKTTAPRVRKLSDPVWDAAHAYRDLDKWASEAAETLLKNDPKQLTLAYQGTVLALKDEKGQLKDVQTEIEKRHKKGLKATSEQRIDENRLRLSIEGTKDETVTLGLKLVASGKMTYGHLRTELGKVGIKLDDTADKAAFLASQLRASQRALGNTIFTDSNKHENRAAGGPVSAGRLYRVNENTPRTEFFAPAMDGRILTHAQGIAAIHGASPSGGGNTITIYNPEPRAAEADIGRVLRRTAALGMA